MNIGRFNKLKINRAVDFGVYLDAGEGVEILLPAKYVPEDAAVGDEVNVFVYTDSEDRLIASTDRPKALVGDFAYLKAKEVNSVGAFMDWGVTAKDLLLPFREQKQHIEPGRTYLTYVYLDDTTKRIVGSTRVEKFLGNVVPRYRRGDAVNVLVTGRTDIGYRCIVDNLHWGMLYANELFAPVRVGQTIEAHVKGVRPDGKIDLMLGDRADRRTDDLASRILERLGERDGHISLSDRSDPEAIKREFACSKRDFKKAIGHLYKDRKINIDDSGIWLIRP